MSVRTILVIFGIGVCLVLCPYYSFSIQVDIQDISGDKYFQAVHEELTGAKDSIYMAMYEISIEPDKTESEVYKLVQDIVDAHTRGVNLRAIFSGEGLTNSSV